MKSFVETRALWTPAVEDHAGVMPAASAPKSDPGDEFTDPVCCWNICPTIHAAKAPTPLVQTKPACS